MCDIFKISNPEQQVIGPTEFENNRPVVWEGTTGGLVKMGGPGATLNADSGNLTELNGIEFDAANGNVITMVPPSSPITHTLTLPATFDNLNSTILTNDGSGALTWSAISAGDGDIVGPASATDNAVPLFDGTTGNLVKNSTIISNASDDLHVQSTTGSTNKTTGSGVFGGGVGVAGDLHADNVQATTMVSGTSLKVKNGADDVTLNRTAGGTTYSLSLPNAQGGSQQVLKNDGVGALSWESASNMTVRHQHLFYNVFPVFDNNNVVNNPIQDSDTLNINHKYLATPANNITFSLPDVTNIVKDDFVLIQFDSLVHNYLTEINTHNTATTFVEGSPINLLWTVIHQNPGPPDPHPYSVTGIDNIEKIIAPPAGQNKLSINGDENGAAAAGSYLLFIWDGVDKWYTLGKLRSQGTGHGPMDGLGTAPIVFNIQ